MFDPSSSPTRPARELIPTLPSALMLAVGLLLLAPAVAWTAAAAAPGAGPAPPQFQPGASCPVPERPNAADGSLRGFTPNTHLYLEVDRKEAPAELYRIDDTALLLISPTLQSPVVLKGLIVAAVPLAKIEKRPDGTVDVRRDAVLQQLGGYTATNDTVSFNIAGHSQVLRVRPPLDFLRPPGTPASHRRR